MAATATQQPQVNQAADASQVPAGNPVIAGETVTNLSASIPLAQIIPSKTNPRKQFDGPEMDELVESVKRLGVLQPVLVRPIDAPQGIPPVAGSYFSLDANGAYRDFELVCGERRYRSAVKAGLDAIPAVIRELTDEQAREIQIIENLQRKDIEPIEEAHGYVALLAAYRANAESGYSGKKLVEEMAAKVGKSTRYIYARMKLAEAEPEVQQAVREGKIEASHADELVRLKPAEQREQVKRLAAKPGTSVKELRKSLRPQASKPKGSPFAAPTPAAVGGPPPDDACSDLRRVDIRPSLEAQVRLFARVREVHQKGIASHKFESADCRHMPWDEGLLALVPRAYDWVEAEAIALGLPVAEILRNEPVPKKKSSPPPPPPGKASAAAAPKGSARPGVCRVCGCRPQHRCVLHFASGKRKTFETCVLKDGVCSNPECQKASKKAAVPKVLSSGKRAGATGKTARKASSSRGTAKKAGR